MNNIFKDAKFGDKFIDKSGEIVIFLRTFVSNGIWHYVSNGITEYSVDDNGKVNKIYFPNGIDIVSKYQESIDEEKLDELAEKYSHDYYNWMEIYRAYKAGYRKAKEK